MMRKLFSTGVFLLVLTTLFFTVPKKTWAAEAGDACCSSNQTRNGNNCISNACSNIESTCDFRIGGIIKVGSLIPNCSKAARDACNITMQNGFSSTDEAANIFCDALGDYSVVCDRLGVKGFIKNHIADPASSPVCDGDTSLLCNSRDVCESKNPAEECVPISFVGGVSIGNHPGGCEKYTNNKIACTVEEGNTSGDYCCKSQIGCNNIGGQIATPDDLDSINASFYLCDQVPGELNSKCLDCDGIWTAVGCIKTDPDSIVGAIMTVGISIAGGVALLMFLAAGFMLSVSQGEPKRTSDAKEMLTSAIIGLLFIIFSVTILQFIGVDILRIPGFGG